MQPSQPRKMLPLPVARILAILGALTSVTITAVLWWGVSANQGMWPLPALYFIEVAGLSVLAAAAFMLGLRAGGSLMWVAVGVLLAFSILGAFSVGVFYVPSLLLLVAASLTNDVLAKRSLTRHIALCCLAAAVQAGLMLAVIRIL